MGDRRAEVFVLRIAAVGTGDGAGWHGRVEHVHSGAATIFHSLDEMGAFIAACTPRMLDGVAASTTDQASACLSEKDNERGSP
jgi:hypothetical protein